MSLLQRAPRTVALECGEQQLRRWGLEESVRVRDRGMVADRRTPDGLVGAPTAGISERDGVVIVAPTEALPDPLPERLAERLEALAVDRPVMIDLSGVMVVSAAPEVGLVGWALGGSQQPGQCCVVCARVTARALLRKWHISRCLAVFGSIGDALQARRFAHDGYGRGWQPDPPAARHARGSSDQVTLGAPGPSDRAPARDKHDAFPEAADL